MQKLNLDWAEKIKELLSRNGLSLRSAEKYADGVITRSYLSDWMFGRVPEYETALKFLSYFSEEERNECLLAAGFVPKAESSKLEESMQINQHMDETANRLNQKWADAIRDLLLKHELSLRTAVEFTNAAASKAYLSKWLKGQVPQYNVAISFLNHFPLEDRFKCLSVTAYPPPPEWSASQENIVTEDTARLIMEDFHNAIREIQIDDAFRDQITKALLSTLDKRKC